MNISDLLVSYKQVPMPEYYQDEVQPVSDLQPLIDRVQSIDSTQNKPDLSRIQWKEYTSTSIPTEQTSSNDIVNFFVNKGLTKEQAKGIYGNLMQESNGKLDALSSDGHNSYGLAQWTGSRKVRLFNKYGNHPTKQQQLEFIWDELNSTHKDALKALQNTTTVDQATKAFMDKFEKPASWAANLKARLRYANSIS